MNTLSNNKNQEDRPYFSVIIPMYNREDTISRCIESCLSQDFKDYEVIVVDDASEDKSLEVAESYFSDSRVRTIKCTENHGVCYCRGLGVKHSKGQWVMFIDSDDAFNAGAFRSIYNETIIVPKEVSEIRFRCFCQEIGKDTPIPMMPGGIIGLKEYLMWLEDVFNKGRDANTDVLYCQRRKIYDYLNWPTDRQYEMLYHIVLASKIKMFMSDKVVAVMHNDALNRITKEHLCFYKYIKISQDNADSIVRIIEGYGRDMKRYCPKFYKFLFRVAGNLFMRAGQRYKGFRYLLKYLILRPWDIVAWGLLLIGLIGPRVSYGAKRISKRIVHIM